jgi:NAD-dependent deacetylase
MTEKINKLVPLLKAARRVLFITGAGVSVESGIPSFRGSTAAFKEGLTEDGIPFEIALSGPAFKRHPERTWKYFFQLELALRGKQPNAAHRAMADLEQRGCKVCVATQNIDGLHQTAGSKRVIELHGNLRRLVCRACNYCSSPETFEGLPSLPRCPQCSRVLRPDAVLYEEMLPEDALEEFENEQRQGFDLIFSVGTTSVFNYVLAPIFNASYRGVPTVEINPEETPLSGVVTCRFAAPAGKVLQELLTAVQR